MKTTAYRLLIVFLNHWMPSLFVLIVAARWVVACESVQLHNAEQILANRLEISNNALAMTAHETMPGIHQDVRPLVKQLDELQDSLEELSDKLDTSIGELRETTAANRMMIETQLK